MLSNNSKKAKGQDGRPDIPQPLSTATSVAIGVVVIVVVALAALVVLGPSNPSNASESAAGQTSQQPQASSQASTGEVTRVTVTVEGMSFVPSTIEVPVGNELVITFENTGDQRHDLVFPNGVGTGPLAPGESAEIDYGIVAQSAKGWCTIAGHRQMGMVLNLVASGNQASSDTNAPTNTHADHVARTENRLGLTSAALTDAAGAQEPYPAELSPLPAADGPVTHQYTFVVTEDEEALTEGVVRPLWTYNGTSPGPTLHGRVGDEFVITLENQGTMGHSIDFHAGETPPNELMVSIEPGESLEYRFTAGRSGIWMYHCSTMPMSLHIANGMFGAVIIEPDNLEPVDKQFVLIQSELYLDDPGADSLTADPAGRAALDKISAFDPDVVMFNGRAYQYQAHPLSVRTGERVRFWVLDVGPNEPWAFHIVGTQFDTVWSEGSYSIHHGQSANRLTEGTTGAQVLPLLAAQGGFVELVVNQPGTYPIVNHVMALAEKGAYGLLEVE